MTIEQFQCPHCKNGITAQIVRGVLYTLANEGNTVEAIEIPVACMECGTAIVLSVTPRVMVQDVLAVRVVPGDPEKWRDETVVKAVSETKK